MSKRVHMDPIDLRIVEAFDRNARESYSSIGKKLGLAPRTVQRRVGKMVRAGFIRNFDVIVNASSLGLGEAVCDIQVIGNVRNEEVRNRLLKIPNVSEIITLAGGTLVVYVYYRDSGELESLLHQVGVTPGVADVQYEVSPRLEDRKEKMSPLSWRIVHSLNHNARREFIEVAAETGLSARTVQRKVRWLTRLGMVRFGVDVDISRAEELFVYILIVRLRLGTPKPKVLERIKQQVSTVWRELRTVNPFAVILSLYAQRTFDIERDVETVRLVPDVVGVRVLIVTGDRRNTSWLDSKISEYGTVSRD